MLNLDLKSGKFGIVELRFIVFPYWFAEDCCAYEVVNVLMVLMVFLFDSILVFKGLEFF